MQVSYISWWKTSLVGETCNIESYNEKQNVDVVISICNFLDEIVPKQYYCEQVIYINDLHWLLLQLYHWCMKDKL